MRPGGPVAEETRRHLALAQAAGQPVLVLVPDPLQFFVFKFDRRPRPELPPLGLGVLTDLPDRNLCQPLNLVARVGRRVQIYLAVSMILRDDDPRIVVARGGGLALQPFKENVARRRHLDVQAQGLFAMTFERHSGRLPVFGESASRLPCPLQTLLTLRQSFECPGARYPSVQGKIAVLVGSGRIGRFLGGADGREVLEAGEL